MGAMYASTFISVVMSAPYMDRSRNLRRITLATIVFSVIGNLTYTLSFSPYMPIFGRLLSSVKDGVRICALGRIQDIDLFQI